MDMAIQMATTHRLQPAALTTTLVANEGSEDVGFGGDTVNPPGTAPVKVGLEPGVFAVGAGYLKSLAKALGRSERGDAGRERQGKK